MNDVFRKFRFYGFVQFTKFLLREFHYRVWRETIKGSYSQWGEDVIIDKLLGGKRRGFYIDVGANDPFRFNNTYRFYKKGWSGINVEPDKQKIILLKEKRSRDINLNVAIGRDKGKLNFYTFDPNTLSTLSRTVAKSYLNSGFRLLDKSMVKVDRLSNIFEKYLGTNKIDLMSVDTEGFDLQVLSSNNWDLYRPKIICIEVTKRLMKKSKLISNKRDIISFLKSRGYVEKFRSDINGIFIDVR